MNTVATENIAVSKSIRVQAPQAHVFDVFTAHIGRWWPLPTHHIGAAPASTVVIEPFVGGRWFERGIDGSECDWGRVLAWEPPGRVVLAWEIGADWKHQPGLGTEVEVRFIAESETATRVELEHRHLERYGEHAAHMRDGFDTDDAWAGMLQLMAQSAVQR